MKLLLFFVLCTITQFSHALIPGMGVDVVIDPWNLAQTTQQATTAATELANQYKQIQYELSNLKNYDGNQMQWSHAQSLLQQLGSTTERGNALSYNMQNLDMAFKQKFPGYAPSQNYNEAYQGWSSTTMDTLRNTLLTAGMQANAFDDEQNTLDQLKSLSTTAEGRMQAVQVGNMIASEQVGQMQKLRQLVISQTNAQNTYMAYRVQREQAQEVADENMFKHPLPFPKYGTGQGFGVGNMPQINH
jgi:P-type conjugative transfer protein TrbJ